MTTERPISVILSDRFRKDIKHLLKKYRHVRDDVQVLIDELEKDYPRRSNYWNSFPCL